MCHSFGICYKESLSPVCPGNSVSTRVEIVGGFGDVLDYGCKFWVKLDYFYLLVSELDYFVLRRKVLNEKTSSNFHPERKKT